MADIIDFGGLTQAQKNYVIKHLGMPSGHDYGWIRDLFKRAFDKEITGDSIAKIESMNPVKIGEAREAYLNSYKQHNLYHPVVVLDYLQRVIDIGFEEHAYGSTKLPQKDPDTEQVTMVDVLLTRRDIKQAKDALKICLDLYIKDKEIENRPDKNSLPQATDGLSGMALAKTSA